MKNILGCASVLFLAWLAFNAIALIADLLFSNPVTAFITMFGVFIGGMVILFSVITSLLNERNKGE